MKNQFTYPLISGLILLCAISFSADNADNVKDRPSSYEGELSEVEWKDGKLNMTLRAGDISANHTIALAMFDSVGKRSKGFFSETLNFDGKSVCSVYGRDGAVQSIHFYLGKKRVEFKRTENGEWSGKESDSAPAAKSVF